MHHELSSYIYCSDTSRIAQALKQQLESEGMVCVQSAKGRVPDVAAIESNVWRVAIMPGRAGWHLVLTAPEALLCEASPDGKIRFAALSDALGTPGLLREANAMDDGVGVQGEVTLLSDGKGAHRIEGKLLDFDAGHESNEYYEGNGEATWRGHAIDHGDAGEDAAPWSTVSAGFPEDDDKAPDQYKPNLSAAQQSLWFVERLGGRALGAHWRDGGEAWELLANCLAHGEPVPVHGAVTLTFQWPTRDRAWPEVSPKAAQSLPPFEYGNGNAIYIGDRVQLTNGAEGEVVNLLATINRDRAWARYAAVRVGERVRMIEMQCVKRGLYRFIDLTCLHVAAEPGAKPTVEELERQAEAGDVDAMVQLGFIYYVGDGQVPNPPGSSRWLAAAAKLDHPDACYLLAQHHRAEFGVRYNAKKILSLAENGYRHGSVEAAETVIDYALAGTQLEVMRRMASEGNAMAQFELAKRLRDGKDLTQDVGEAARLFEVAAAQGHAYAQQEIGLCYDTGRGVAEDAARAAYWYGQAIDRGFRGAYPLLAALYAKGRGVDKDVERAMALLEYAKQEGIPGAKEALADMELT